MMTLLTVAIAVPVLVLVAAWFAVEQAGAPPPDDLQQQEDLDHAWLMALWWVP